MCSVLVVLFMLFMCCFVVARPDIIILTCAPINMYRRANICSKREGTKAAGDGSYGGNSRSAEKVILEIGDKSTS